MYDIIYSSLNRQAKGLELLLALMHEEYDLLLKRNTEEIMVLEMSIHELLRQLAAEKTMVMRMLGGGKLLDYAQMLPEEQGLALRALWHEADELEQQCSRQATINVEFSLALLDQSQASLMFLHKRLMPENHNTYGRSGTYTNARPDAAILSGRL
jgi:uncharacterized protein YbjQ (UPF0145 family)